MMMKEGFTADETTRIIQRFYRTQRKISLSQENSHNSSPITNHRGLLNLSSSPIGKKPLSVRDQQLDLIAFSQNIHMLNQEIHKNLRQNKPGVHLDKVQKLPSDYKRPPGFSLVPGLLGAVPGGEKLKNKSKSNSSKTSSKNSSKDDALK